MLVRILADNPGRSFTRNIDSKFVTTVKELLRDGRDMSVQQILRETLDSFETNKADDETLAPLREMWTKEKVKWQKRGAQITAYVRTADPNERTNSDHRACHSRITYDPPISKLRTTIKTTLHVITALEASRHPTN